MKSETGWNNQPVSLTDNDLVAKGPVC